MPTVEYQLLDVFVDDDAAGNPAAVVTDAAGLSDAQQQAVATAAGVSDTAFVTQRAGGPHLRWFTPACEIDLCGHATLAAAAALETGPRTAFSYSGGRLEVAVEAIGGEPLYWLGRPAPELFDPPMPDDSIVAALGGRLDELPVMATSDGDLIVPLVDAAEVESLRPDMGALAAACTAAGMRGVAVIAGGEDRFEVRARFFAPHLGIAEDPVTGSVHGAIAVYLWQCELVACHPDELRALSRQGSPQGRQGTVWLRLHLGEDKPTSVEVGGRVAARGAGQARV